MKIIESKTGQIPASDVSVFSFLSDFTNFANLIPSEKIKNWTATPDSCSFTFDGIGQAGLKIVEKIPYNLIKISTDDNTPFRFLLRINIDLKSTNSCEVRIIIEPDVNPILFGMIRKPLQSFADMLIERMEKMKF